MLASTNCGCKLEFRAHEIKYDAQIMELFKTRLKITKFYC